MLDLNSIPSPCFDRVAKADCPNRKAGCAATCDAWKKHCERKRTIAKNIYAEAQVEQFLRGHKSRFATRGGRR